MGPEIRFTVLGKPEPRGSKQSFVPLSKDGQPFRRAGGGVMVATKDTNPKSGGWMKLIAAVVRREYQQPMLRGPLRVDLDFYLARPKSHYGTGRNAGVLKATAPDFPATKPDRLKLARAVEDALTDVVYCDDAQAVTGNVMKHYGEPQRVEISITEL